jgi:hypothetical protein
VLPAFLVAETVVREEGAGQEISLDASQGKLLSLTLGITRIIEQESLDVSIWGSSDGSNWGAKPLASFPQKFYCGTYPLELDLTAHPEITHVRAQWKVNRWGRGEAQPLFGFYLFAQEALAAATAARST